MSYRFKELREQHELKQQDVADILNIPLSTYRSYETYKREPNIEILTKLADHYNVSVDHILNYVPQTVEKLTAKEDKHIKKYRELDIHGKDIVDTILDKEHERCSNKEGKDVPMSFARVAAFGGGTMDIPVPNDDVTPEELDLIVKKQENDRVKNEILAMIEANEKMED